MSLISPSPPLEPYWLANQQPKVLALVRALAPVIASQSISINAICPSMTESALTHGTMSVVPKELVSTMDKVMEAYEQLIDTDDSSTALEIKADGIFDRKPLDPALAQQWIDFGMGGFTAGK